MGIMLAEKAIGHTGRKIARELRLALRDLGAQPAVLDRIAWTDVAEVVGIARGLGASFELLRVIGARGDTLSDELVLTYLLAYNERSFGKPDDTTAD
jgi:hypothetical protein